MQLYPHMNGQELSNAIYTMSKLNSREQIKGLCVHILENLHRIFDNKSIIILLYSVTSISLDYPPLIEGIDRFLVESRQFHSLSGQDIADLIFTYSKNQRLLLKSRIYAKIEEHSKKIITDINLISISNIFNSLANFSQTPFSPEFYKLFEMRILQVLAKMSYRMISSVLRGYQEQNLISNDRLFAEIYKQLIQKLKSNAPAPIDLQSLSTMIYTFALNNKFVSEDPSLFPLLEEQVKLQLLSTRKSLFTTKQLQFLLYSFSRIHDFH